MSDSVTVPTCFKVELSERQLAEVGKAAILLAYNQAIDGGLNAHQRLWMTIPITIEIGLSPDRKRGGPPRQLEPCSNPSTQYLWCVSVDGFSWCM